MSKYEYLPIEQVKAGDIVEAVNGTIRAYTIGKLYIVKDIMNEIVFTEADNTGSSCTGWHINNWKLVKTLPGEYARVGDEYIKVENGDGVFSEQQGNIITIENIVDAHIYWKSMAGNETDQFRVLCKGPQSDKNIGDNQHWHDFMTNLKDTIDDNQYYPAEREAGFGLSDAGIEELNELVKEFIDTWNETSIPTYIARQYKMEIFYENDIVNPYDNRLISDNQPKPKTTVAQSEPIAQTNKETKMNQDINLTVNVDGKKVTVKQPKEPKPKTDFQIEKSCKFEGTYYNYSGEHIESLLFKTEKEACDLIGRPGLENAKVIVRKIVAIKKQKIQLEDA